MASEYPSAAVPTGLFNTVNVIHAEIALNKISGSLNEIIYLITDVSIAFTDIYYY
jgi:hypothetical protein